MNEQEPNRSKPDKHLKILSLAKKLLQHKTFKNIGYLTVGNVLAQMVALVGAFYIPRLLGPEKYGIYNTVLAYVGLFSVFTFTGLTKVIIREAAKDTSKTREILEATIGLRNLFALFASFLSIIVVLFINYDVGTKLYVTIYSFNLFLRGLYGSINTIFQAHQRMKILGILAIIRQLIKVPIAIILLYMGFGVLSLIVLHLAIELALFPFLYRYSRKLIAFNLFSRIKLNKNYVFSGARFSLLEFLNILSGKIDLVMLSFLTTPQNVGIYALAYRLVDKGLILRGPISQSLFPYYSNKFNNKRPNIKDLIIHTGLIAIPLLIFLIPAILFIEPFIHKVIGPEFIESASIFSVLVLYLIINFSVIPWGLFLQTTGREKFVLATVTMTAFLNVTLNFVFYKFYGVIGIAYSTLIVQGCSFLFQLMFSTIKIKSLT